MKNILKGVEPDKLEHYRENFPDNSWKQCTQGGSTKARKQEVKERKQQVQQQLRALNYSG